MMEVSGSGSTTLVGRYCIVGIAVALGNQTESREEIWFLFML
jgi:hypothetical protein